MITFEFQKACDFKPGLAHKQWLKNVIRQEGLQPGDIAYYFCDDAYLYERNVQFLHHDTLTDIITFDHRVGDVVSGDIMISLDRVGENSQKFGVTFQKELLRVIVHGILHLCGYKDKSDEEAAQMHSMEDASLAMFSRENNL